MTETGELVAVIDTNKGKIRLKLFQDKTPITVANFVNLAQRNFYNDLKFHRVISDFMVQGGCPLGSGTGGPGYSFQDEFVDDLQHDKPGILSMANSGPDTNGSQFFITHLATPWLDQHHTVFGEVVSSEDQEVVNSIAEDDQINSITIEGDCSKLTEISKSHIDKWNQTLDQK
jgi:peptidyl-prolyl cis-trans isomerase B (cyclophilin B)